MHVLNRCVEVGRGLGVDVFGVFQIGQRDGALVVEQLGARQLLVGQLLIGLELLVVGERRRQIGTVDKQQNLALLYVITKLGLDLDYAAAAQRYHGNGPVHIRSNHAVDVDLVAHFADVHSRQRKLSGILHREDVGVGVGLHDGARRRLGLGVRAG